VTEAKNPSRTIIANDPDASEVDKAAVKAVKAFERAAKAVRDYIAEHTKVFEPFRELVAKLEVKRKLADAAMRATDASFGEWKRSEQRTYDNALLCELIGEEKFVELGGTVSKVDTYELPRDKLELAILAKKIPEGVVEKIRTITAKYSAPKGGAPLG
jgi:hypothetical protein